MIRDRYSAGSYVVPGTGESEYHVVLPTIHNSFICVFTSRYFPLSFAILLLIVILVGKV